MLDALNASRFIHHNFRIGDGQTRSANQTALMAFNHRSIISPPAAAKVTLEKVIPSGGFIMHERILDRTRRKTEKDRRGEGEERKEKREEESIGEIKNYKNVIEFRVACPRPRGHGSAAAAQ